MTKQEAFEVLGVSKVGDLARLLGISHSAVSQWTAEKIPPLRAYQIRDLVQKRKPMKSVKKAA